MVKSLVNNIILQIFFFFSKRSLVSSTFRTGFFRILQIKTQIFIISKLQLKLCLIFQPPQATVVYIIPNLTRDKFTTGYNSDFKNDYLCV